MTRDQTVLFLPPKAALSLDFVTQLPQGDNGLSEPSPPTPLSIGLTFLAVILNSFLIMKIVNKNNHSLSGSLHR